MRGSRSASANYVIRTINWRKKGDLHYSRDAFERALELLTLTIMDPKNKTKGKLKELTRCREFLIDYFLYDNQYHFSDEFWENYFLDFNYAAAIQRGR